MSRLIAQLSCFGHYTPKDTHNTDGIQSVLVTFDKAYNLLEYYARVSDMRRAEIADDVERTQSWLEYEHNHLKRWAAIEILKDVVLKRRHCNVSEVTEANNVIVRHTHILTEILQLSITDKYGIPCGDIGTIQH